MECIYVKKFDTETGKMMVVGITKEQIKQYKEWKFTPATIGEFRDFCRGKL